MDFASKKSNVVDHVCVNYANEGRFLKACEEAIRMSPGMELCVRDIKTRKSVNKKEVYWYIHKAQNGDQSAVEVLVNSYMPYALRKAVDYCKEFNAETLVDDVYQEFLLCVQEEVLNYDLKLKSDFSWLLATKFYRVAMDTIYGKSNNKYRLPTHVIEPITRVKRYVEENCLTEDDRSSIMNYCKDTLNLDEEKSEVIFECQHGIEDIDGVDETSMMTENFEGMIIDNMMKDVIRESINVLKDKEKDVIVRRFGLNNEVEITLEETGKLMDITRERVRQIEVKALEKMRRYLGRNGCGYVDYCAA